MKDLMIVFASLLLILILISAFGGGMMVKEPFSEDIGFGDYGSMPQEIHTPVEPSAPAAAPLVQDVVVDSNAVVQASSPPLIEPFQGCMYAGCMMTP